MPARNRSFELHGVRCATRSLGRAYSHAIAAAALAKAYGSDYDTQSGIFDSPDSRAVFSSPCGSPRVKYMRSPSDSISIRVERRIGSSNCTICRGTKLFGSMSQMLCQSRKKNGTGSWLEPDPDRLGQPTGGILAVNNAGSTAL